MITEQIWCSDMDNKKLIVIATIGLLFMVSAIFAAEKDIYDEWNMSYSVGSEDGLYSISIDNEGNVYSGGRLGTAGINIRFEVMKHNSSGDFEWNRSLVAGTWSQAYDTAVDSEGNLYAVGREWYTTNNLQIKKYYPNGTLAWNITDDTGVRIAFGVAVDDNDHIFVVGLCTDCFNSTSGYDWIIRKYNSSGAENFTHWNKTIDAKASDDIARDIVIDSTGDIYVVGRASNIVTTTSGEDWWIKKFHPNGTEYTTAEGWNITFDSGSNDDYAMHAAIDCEDNIYVTGTDFNALSGSSNDDWRIKKYQSDGTEITTGWNKVEGDDTDGYDTPRGVEVDQSCDVYLTGIFQPAQGFTDTNWIIKKYNSTGADLNWNITLDGGGANTPDEGSAIAVDANNDVFFGGEYYEATGNTTNSVDWFMIKYQGGTKCNLWDVDTWTIGSNRTCTGRNLNFTNLTITEGGSLSLWGGTNLSVTNLNISTTGDAIFIEAGSKLVIG